MRRKKRTLTLIEIMIVIVLIGLIGSVIGFNMKGSLEEGRAFKSKAAREQIEDIFMLELARGTSIDYILNHKAKVLDESGLVKNPKDFLKDGWGKEFEISIDDDNTDKIIVYSEKLEEYEKKRKKGKK